MTYGALRDRVGLIASSIAENVRKPGGGRPRIGLVFHNGSEIAIALLASAIAGEAAPFNPASKAAELDAYFRSCRLDALIVPEDYNGPAVTIAEKSGLRLLRLQPGGGLLGITPSGNSLPAPDPDDIALVLMTSGSTGRPKIVPLSHRNVCTSAGDVSRSMNLGPDDRCLTMWEQHHIGGLVDLLMAPIASGGCIIATPGFNAPLFFELLNKAKPTWYQGVPTTLNELAIHASRHGIAAKPSSLRLVRSVAAALHPKLMGEIEALFGVPVIQTFGNDRGRALDQFDRAAAGGSQARLRWTFLRYRNQDRRTGRRKPAAGRDRRSRQSAAPMSSAAMKAIRKPMHGSFAMAGSTLATSAISMPMATFS